MASALETIAKNTIQFIEKLLSFSFNFSKDKKKINKRSPHYQRKILQTYLEKAGFTEVDPDILYKNVFYTTAGILLAATLAIFLLGLFNGRPLLGILLFLAGMWTTFFILLWILIWVIVYFYLDMRIYRRTKELEAVLPDFLQLTSANIFAGMPVDRALWYAVRPRFGVLAREIEDVAKKTIAGESLEESLLEFTNKYDSAVLKRSISLLLEGMKSGGEMTDLLNKIAIDIQEATILRKEMAASVMTYVIFISFASLIIAPFLFGLATQLLRVVTNIMTQLAATSSSAGTRGFSFHLSPDAVTVQDFTIFAYTMLGIGSFFSACIISSIRKGSVKDGLKNIPLFIIVSWLVYFVSRI
ncbi:hypothetical protein D6783_00135, partial [Candidatus Woesearchaeota archaeon]